MKNKKIMASILTAMLCFGSMSVFAYDYEDELTYYQAHQTEQAIQTLAEKNILIGTENGMEPGREVSRAEALTLALRCFNVNAPHTNAAPFDDVSAAHWARDAVAYAKAQGWVDGAGDNLFMPDRAVSGAELCKMLLAVRGDADVSIDNIAALAVQSGLIQMQSEQELLEKAALTRGDTARLCVNALNIKTISKDAQQPSFSQKLAELTPDDENYCISPYSLKTALAMAANGATGDNLKELSDLLGIDDLSAFNKNLKEQTTRYSSDTKLTLETANSIWLNATDSFGNRFSDNFQKTIADYYDGTAHTTDREHVVNDVNGWVNEKTHEKIPSLLSPNDNQSAAYLVNAVYFLGDWQTPFEAELTRDDTFHTRSGEEKTIPFMHDTRNVRYYGDSHTQMIALPYKSDDESNPFSMYIAMSNSTHPLEEYIPQMSEQYVSVSLPKFKTEYTQDFTEMLQTLGLKNCMELSDGFSPMFSPANISFAIEKVLQKAYLAVDEKGTEAAAATAVMMAAAAAMPTDFPVPIPFNANKPFTYFIYDELAQETLFIGEYAF